MTTPAPALPKMPSFKLAPIIAITCIVAMAGAYFLFLYGTWNQFQMDRTERDKRLDQILDKLTTKLDDEECTDCEDDDGPGSNGKVVDGLLRPSE